MLHLRRYVTHPPSDIFVTEMCRGRRRREGHGARPSRLAPLVALLLALSGGDSAADEAAPGASAEQPAAAEATADDVLF